MSSILNALKRLEAESDPRTPSQDLPGVWRDRPAAGQLPDETPQTGRFRNRLGMGLIITVIVLLGGLFWVKRGAGTPTIRSNHL